MTCSPAGTVLQVSKTVFTLAIAISGCVKQISLILQHPFGLLLVLIDVIGKLSRIHMRV